MESQVKAVRLQNRLGKQNSHEDMKKLIEPVSKSNKDVSEEVTKTKTETSANNNKVIENLNNKFLRTMNDRGKIANYLLSPLSKISNPEKTNQFKLVKESTSIRVYDLFIQKKYQLHYSTIC